VGGHLLDPDEGDAPYRGHKDSCDDVTGVHPPVLAAARPGTPTARAASVTMRG
jgi:hypothetical protein